MSKKPMVSFDKGLFKFRSGRGLYTVPDSQIDTVYTTVFEMPKIVIQTHKNTITLYYADASDMDQDLKTLEDGLQYEAVQVKELIEEEFEPSIGQAFDIYKKALKANPDSAIQLHCIIHNLCMEMWRQYRDASPAEATKAALAFSDKFMRDRFNIDFTVYKARGDYDGRH